jgi:hypothetical protein
VGYRRVYPLPPELPLNQSQAPGRSFNVLALLFPQLSNLMIEGELLLA